MLMVYVKSLKMKGYLVKFQYAPMTQTGLDAGKLVQKTVMVPSCLIATQDGNFGIGSLDDIVPILSQTELTALKQAAIPEFKEDELKPDEKVKELQELVEEQEKPDDK